MCTTGFRTRELMQATVLTRDGNEPGKWTVVQLHGSDLPWSMNEVHASSKQEWGTKGMTELPCIY